MSEDKTDQKPGSSSSPGNEVAKSYRVKKSTLSGSPIINALRHMETISHSITEAIQTRENVVMMRVNNETLRNLDMLIEAEVTKSRSESAAYLVGEGIKAQKEFFDRIGEVTDQITKLRTQLRDTIKSTK